MTTQKDYPKLEQGSFEQFRVINALNPKYQETKQQNTSVFDPPQEVEWKINTEWLPLVFGLFLLLIMIFLTPTDDE
jgi:hypothetical protein